MAIQSNSLGKISIQLNGVCTTVNNGTINDLLKALQIPSELIIVELNGTIIAGGDHATTPLAQNDVVEIIRYIGGGKK